MAFPDNEVNSPWPGIKATPTRPADLIKSMSASKDNACRFFSTSRLFLVELFKHIKANCSVVTLACLINAVKLPLDFWSMFCDARG